MTDTMFVLLHSYALMHCITVFS